MRSHGLLRLPISDHGSREILSPAIAWSSRSLCARMGFCGCRSQIMVHARFCPPPLHGAAARYALAWASAVADLRSNSKS
jgi:hypothetical protein